MVDAFDTLLSFAEVAIVLAGFSAIVVVLKRGTAGKWASVDADRFHGMVIHAVCAVIFCFLPTLVNVVVQDSATTFHISCAVLGVQILLHSFGVIALSTTGVGVKLSMLFGVLIGLLQFLAFSDWGVQREFDIYVVGIIWHIFQAGLLFVMLVWIPAASVDTESES